MLDRAIATQHAQYTFTETTRSPRGKRSLRVVRQRCLRLLRTLSRVLGEFVSAGGPLS